MADFTQGRWVKATLGETVEVGTDRPQMAGEPLRPVPLTASVDSLPAMYSVGESTIVGVWYPAGKRFVGFDKPMPETVWPVDPVDGMPLEHNGRRLCFVASSLGSISAARRDEVPARRLAGMTENNIAKFVEGHNG